MQGLSTLMRAVWIAGTFALLGAGPATRSTTQPIQLKHLDLNAFNLHLDYPADWTVLDHPANNQVLSMQTQAPGKADQNLGIMGLRIAAGPETARDDETLKQISGGMVDYLFNHGGKNIAVKPDTLGDIPARRITVTTESSRAVYIVAVLHHTEYVFNIAAPAERMDKMMDAASEVITSFKVTE